MDNKYTGIYRAKCLNNQDPDGHGKILVHIYERDGELSYSEENHQWIPVLSQYGGIRGMGLFMLPPVMADGYVIFEDGDPNLPVWVGTVPFSNLTEIDEEASNKAGYTVLRNLQSIPPESGNDPTTIILKTQYPSMPNIDIETDTIVENLLIMNEEKFEIHHVNKEVYEYSDSGESSSNPGTYFRMTDNAIELGVITKDKRVNGIAITEEGIMIRSNNGEYVLVTDNKIEIAGTDKSTINIKNKDNGNIIILSKTIINDAESIILGPPGAQGGGAAVTTMSICPFTGLPTHQGSSKVIIGG